MICILRENKIFVREIQGTCTILACPQDVRLMSRFSPVFSVVSLTPGSHRGPQPQLTSTRLFFTVHLIFLSLPPHHTLNLFA